MSEEITILPTFLLPIVVGFATAGYGVYYETRYVSRSTTITNIINLLITFAFTAVLSIPFLLVTIVLGLGFYVIHQDLHHSPQKRWVSFLFGSKTQGALTAFNGFFVNDWIMTIFQPVYRYVGDTEVPLNELTLYVHIMAFIIIIGLTHTSGEIVAWLKKRKRNS